MVCSNNPFSMSFRRATKLLYLQSRLRRNNDLIIVLGPQQAALRHADANDKDADVRRQFVTNLGA
jgi:hypothetical protein